MSRGEREIRDEVSFQASEGQGRNKQAQPSLKAYRVEFIGPLTEYPGTDNEKVGTSKCFGYALNLLNTCTHQETAAFY